MKYQIKCKNETEARLIEKLLHMSLDNVKIFTSKRAHLGNYVYVETIKIDSSYHIDSKKFLGNFNPYVEMFKKNGSQKQG